MQLLSVLLSLLRISTRVVVVVAVRIIVNVIFGIVIIIDGIIIFGVAFGCGIRLASGKDQGTVIIHLKRRMIVAVEIIISVVFGIIIIIIENGEGPTLKPVDLIIIVSDEANGPIIMGGRVLGRSVVVTIAIVMIIK